MGEAPSGRGVRDTLTMPAVVTAARPPPVTAQQPRHLTVVGERAGGAAYRLPAQPTPLIGRAPELDAARRYLAQGVRLLTFTGPGGAGKTRLAVEVAATLADEFEDGAVFVDLAPFGATALVVAAIAQAVGARETENEPLVDGVKRALQARRILLLLDNF